MEHQAVTATEKRWSLADDGWATWGPQDHDRLLGPLAVAQALGYSSENAPGAIEAYEQITRSIEALHALERIRDWMVDHPDVTEVAGAVDIFGLILSIVSSPDADQGAGAEVGR